MSNVGLDPREEIIEMLTQEMAAVKRHLSEIRTQIESMQAAVDKEQGRYAAVATDLRNIKDNLDTVPREDIRDKYDEALEIRFRLATMRGQLEKFESNYGYLEQKQAMMAQVLGKLRGIEMLPVGGEEDKPTGAGAADIIDIIRAQEEERQRLARTMHDGPAQSLTNFILQAEICQRLFNINPDRAAEELNNLKTNASKTFQKVRDFIFDLRPMMLDDLGVVPTVRRYVESFREKNDIDATVEIEGTERHLESYRAVMIFRSIQELMAMSRDFGSAGQIAVQLNVSADPITFSVQDDGHGFNAVAVEEGDLEVTHKDPRIKALILMQNKFNLVSGSLEVHSSEDDGTIVRLTMPIKE